MTDNEKLLFKYLSLSIGTDYVGLAEFTKNPMDAYDMAVRDCFVLNAKGPEVSALRRAALLLSAGVYRGSDELEETIKIEEDKDSIYLERLENRMERINKRRRGNLNYKPSRATEEGLVNDIKELIGIIRKEHGQ